MKSKLLNYKGQNLNEFPASLLENRQITNLNLDDNKISSIPTWLPELTNLKVLYLNNNDINNIEVLTKLPHLEVLHLNNNQINLIPDSIGNLAHLKRLFINDNYINWLPDTICNLPQLRVLLAAKNELTSIPLRIGQLRQLEVLNLFDNRITCIPESIGQLSSLDYLQLGQNEISELHESIGSLHSVTSFEIFSNKLKDLSTQLSQLKELKNFNIGDNKITRIENIPDSVRRLSIYANPVDYIAPSILEKFKELYREYQSDYLFVDSIQASVLKLDKDKFGRQLKITDITGRKIHWTDEKHMPRELIKKWELQRDDLEQNEED
jgi:Leucine-rich repeat (LRR) protein